MDDGLCLRNVQIFKEGLPLVGLTHHIAPGDVLSVMGPSGSGKSTLLSYITGTLARDFTVEGEILLDGIDIAPVPPHLRRVGILFQDDLLFAHLSVGANLAFGLPAGGSRFARREVVEAALEDIGLAGFADRDPATLSGGQKTRVALMRMLLSKPRVLLLDEPFSRLDATLRGQIREMVFETARKHALPVLMVTHDQSDADAAGGAIFDLAAQ